MKRYFAWLIALAALAGLLWCFPLFHVVPLKQAQAAREEAAFNGAEFVNTFWNERLIKSLDRAADAKQVVTAIAANPQQAREQYGRTVGWVQCVHGFVEERFYLPPVISARVHGVHLGGDLFAQLAAGLAPDDVNGCAARDLIEPSANDCVRPEPGGVAGELGEGRLGDFLGQLRRVNLPERGGKDEAEVAANDFCEGVLGVMVRVADEQFQIGVAHAASISPPATQNGQRKLLG